ncbi:FAD-dependent oxidoreductase [Sphingobium subterraneum]|uniref:Succinate dehydrogenase/fumarate reductase flavoprotein subunit n=1 Tax=Sphingobium subterraneum TaxID=627688 RepID=A0A841JB67_9SPHN|nr:succinate dehydrogenase/fumarate reductase flavoprotein subunit [Sphingobium subterraneum]
MSDESYDLVIAGSGSAGLAAAIIAHSLGMRAIVVEKTDLVGGTSCYSGGVIWVPNSRQNVASGVQDSVDRAERYLDSTISNSHEREARRVYLERGGEAVAYLEEKTGPLFYVRAINSPDYYPEADGAEIQGRAMTPITYDGRNLKERFRDLRSPLPELCLFGRQMLELMDVYHLLNARRSLRSAWHTGKLLLRDVKDRLFYRQYGRGTRLTGGNALVARLYKAALDRDIPVVRNTALVGLIKKDGVVCGVEVTQNGVKREILAKRGVVLATGGFPWSKDLREQFMGDTEFGYSATSPDSTGDGIAIAMQNGGQFDRKNSEGAFWTPVSVGTRADGSTARFPHLMADRAKPRLIAVNRLGQRFFNEAENYHDFVRAMHRELGNGDQQPVHLLCDAPYLKKYAFGAIPPLASERRRALRSGYLIEGRTVEELAHKIGVDPSRLKQTITAFNQDARKGVDAEFGKGSSAYNRYLGDATHGPNPCLGPIEKAPFYAIRVYAGDIGTAMGLAADEHSRVLDENGVAIPGLYACGNDRNSIMAGSYPSGGITIGPALVFAYLAVQHASRAQEN